MTRCEQAADGHSGDSASYADLEAVQARIMTDIQARLCANQEEFWRRGQVEIKRMQQQQNEVVEAMMKMQEQQSELATENQRIKGALVEVTAKFEQVVKQMREVIWALPPPVRQHEAHTQVPGEPGKHSASTLPCAGEVSGEGSSHKEPDADQGATPVGLPLTSIWPEAGKGQDADLQEVALCTPPRPSVQEDLMTQSSSSPAVLSLASALPQSLPPGLKLLNLAEWIPDQASPGKSTETPSLPTRSKRMSLSSAEERTYQVEIVKEMGFTTLGIEVNQQQGALRVEHIDEHGLVGKFNSQESDTRILEGDCIVQVNGVEQDPDQMLQEIKAAKVLRLVLVKNQQADSPLTKLRPEAQTFVPFELGERAFCAGSPSTDCDATEQRGKSEATKVNRTLFVDELIGKSPRRN
eukprot:symbB.v1.2.013543.t1/scaffold952.1/size217748/1